MLGKLKHLLGGKASAEAFQARKPGGGKRFSGEAPPQEPPAANSAPPRLDRIVVPQSAMDALPDDPAPLVQAIVNYTNQMTGQGRYKRTELPAAAIQAFHCDYYLAQVLNGGHAQFVGNTRALIEETFCDVVEGLRAMGATDYLILARSGQKWVRENPQEAAQQTGFEGGIAESLSRLDGPFYQLNRKTPLQGAIAAWIAGHPQLHVVPDDQLAAELQALALANPERGRRDAILECASIAARFANPLQVGAAMACWRSGEADFLLGLGNGSYRDVEGEQRMAFALRALGGPRFLVPVEGRGVTLYDCIRHDNSHLPENPLKASMDDIRRFRPDELGEKLAEVSEADIATAMALADRLKLGAALHLLKTRIPGMKALPALTIVHAGPSTDGSETFVCSYVENNEAWMLKVGAEGAIFIKPGKDAKPVTGASRAEIDFHAETHRIEGLR
ncbi:DMP19 family protein [Tropicibacter oceani]|uniref:DNA mimic protein DMP19 C-terminal domain-containing protein n=1 Tax=Tropicibacter oceani TaxID=3058420 RepID=A0ABY8QI94_9RHOB|nr:hypothetical protein [Tropicibacter oceani]WGW04355.1 hypothetical protein QF118_02090 [Tropicibacter oceani]